MNRKSKKIVPSENATKKKRVAKKSKAIAPSLESIMPKNMQPVDLDKFGYLLTADLGIKHVEREVHRFEMAQRMECYGTDMKQYRFGLSHETFIDHATQQMILRLKATIASKKLDVKTVRFPDGVWNAMKHWLKNSDWMMYQFVRKWIERHPVVYIEVTLEANAYHPDIAIPDHETYVNIAVNAKRMGY